MPKTILIVEDDTILRDLISQKLKKENNYEIVEAIDGEEGLKKAKEKRPNIILLDLILPGMDGFGVLEQIKQDPETAKIPVVILSNLGQKEEIEKGMKLGATDFLIKAHFTLSEIAKKVKALLE